MRRFLSSALINCAKLFHLLSDRGEAIYCVSFRSNAALTLEDIKHLRRPAHRVECGRLMALLRLRRQTLPVTARQLSGTLAAMERGKDKKVPPWGVENRAGGKA